MILDTWYFVMREYCYHLFVRALRFLWAVKIMSLMKTTNLYTTGSKTQIYSGALNDSWPFLSLDIKLVHVGVCSLSNPPGNAVGIRSSPPFSHLDHV